MRTTSRRVTARAGLLRPPSAIRPPCTVFDKFESVTRPRECCDAGFETLTALGTLSEGTLSVWAGGACLS